MTGNGFDTSLFGQYGQAWLVTVVLFFMVALTRKWVGEEMNIPFSPLWGYVGAYLPYLVVITFTCSVKFSLLSGIVGYLVGGFFVGRFFDSGGGY